VLKNYYKNQKFVDIAISLLILAFGISFYFSISMAIADTGAYEKINLLFDYDVPWYLDVLGRAPESWNVLEPMSRETIWLKHPLIYLFYWIGLPLKLFGLTEVESAIALVSTASGCTLVLIYNISRVIGSNSIFSIAVTSLYAFSGSTLLTAGMPEAYPLVILFAVAQIQVLVLAVYKSYYVPLWVRSFLGVMGAGTTLFFFAFFVLIEIAIHFEKNGRHFDLTQLIKVDFRRNIAWFMFLFSIVFIIVYWKSLGSVLHDPFQTAKKVVWAVNQNGDKQNILVVLKSFFVYPFILSNPEVFVFGKEKIIDYRSFNYDFLQVMVWLCFLSLIFYGYVKTFKENITLLSVILIWFVFVVLFHLQYQYRGSIFMYAPHHWFLTVIPLMILGKERSSQKKIFILLLLLLIIVILYASNLTVSFPRLMNLVHSYNT
tara:strand:- start:519 stop:1811 length:1293 start_codon:yes stop_codon:yes gene_type:complete